MRFTHSLILSSVVSLTASLPTSATASPAVVPPSAAPGQVKEVAAWLSGAFSSRAQAQTNPKHFEVALHVRPIWPERSDAQWLYVEQALATSLAHPYRQRVYKISWDGEGPVSEVYSLPGDPERFAGAWDQAKSFPPLVPTDLSLRDGCSIHLRKQADGVYKGGTRGTACASERSGARYATSQVSLNDRVLESWDRGFDAQDRQTWGADDGPYRFDRESDGAASESKRVE